MLFVGSIHCQGISKKDNKPYDFYSVQAISRTPRADGFAVQQFNVTPTEFEAANLKIGDQFRAFSDGGLFKLDEKMSIPDLPGILALML